MEDRSTRPHLPLALRQGGRSARGGQQERSLSRAIRSENEDTLAAAYLVREVISMQSEVQSRRVSMLT